MSSRKALRFLLAHKGHQITEAGDVAAATAALAGSARPDVILLDLMLPDGTGVDVLRRVRREAMAIRVAVLTGAADPTLLAAVAALRPDHLMHKPVDFRALIAWVDRQN